MIFPNCEKLGQTIIFTATKDAARHLHTQMEQLGFKCTSIQVRLRLSRVPWCVCRMGALVPCQYVACSAVCAGFEEWQLLCLEA